MARAITRLWQDLLGGNEPVQITGASVTADFFTVLGVSPLLGRTFLPNEDAPEAPPTVVLTHGFWLRWFGGRADVIGRRVSINATHHEVIAVMPQGFSFPDARVQAFAALRTRRNDGRNYSVVARLRTSVDLVAAREEMAAVAAQIARARPVTNADWSATAVPLHEQAVGQIRRPLLVLLAAVGFVLLIACANVANLLLMRGVARGSLPMDGGNSGSWYYRADRPEPPLGHRPGGDISIVSPGYFAAMGIPVVKGRDFNDRDRIGSPHVAILNRTAARAFFGDEDPLGKRLKVSWNDAREVEIMGVVEDIRHSQLHTKPDPCLFMPNAQQPFPFSALVIRTAGNPRTLAEPVKRALYSVDPDQGVGEIRPMEELVANAVAQPKAQTSNR